jgi:hypothetical protein
MTIPGYCAEASLYRSSGQYRAALAAGLAPLGGGAVPQQARPRDCNSCCAGACSGRTGYLLCVNTCVSSGFVCDNGSVNCAPLCANSC